MASAITRLKNRGFLSLLPILVPAVLAGMGYTASQIPWIRLIRKFFMGPGRIKRILLLTFALFNLKNIPFSWTTRVFYPIVYHTWTRKGSRLDPRFLFSPIINPMRAPLLETDYNIHKSNSTYFSDLDVARTHLVSYLCRDGLRAINNNQDTKLVLDPRTQQPALGASGIMLGSVHCSFHREIPPYAPYELWTRVLSWDRKWMYIVTHYVPKGLGQPSEYLDHRFSAAHATTIDQPLDPEWEKKIYATAVSKYVFKLGRLTVHPAVVLEASGLLPERAGGWALEHLTAVDRTLAKPQDEEWTWERVEYRRQQGMEYAAKFGSLDGLARMFRGGEDAVIGSFSA